MKTPHAQHITYASARARNTVAAAAKIAGVSGQTAYKWEAYAWMPALIEEERRKVVGDIHVLLGEHAVMAAQTLATLASQGDREAAKYILDQLYGRPLQRSQVDTTVTTVDGDVVAQMLEAAMERRRVSVRELPSGSMANTRALATPSVEGSSNDDYVTPDPAPSSPDPAEDRDE
jgi:hypothetical protein